MALQEQQQSFKFAGGVETKMDSKAVPPVRLLGLENGVFTKAVSIRKRNGYEALSRAIDGSVDLVADARRNAVRDQEYLLFTNNRCFSRQSGADKWADAGAVICAVGADRPAVHTSTAQTMPDHATIGGVTVYAWEDSLGGVWWTAVDAASGLVYRTPAQADALGQRPRCVAVGGMLHIYYALPTLRRIDVIVVNPAAPTLAVASKIVIEDLDTVNPVYDAVPTERAGTPALIAWHEYGTTNIRIGYVTAGGALGSAASGHPAVYTHAAALNATSPLAVAHAFGDGSTADGLYLAYTSGTDGRVQLLSGGSPSTPIGSVAVPFTAATVVDVTRAALVTNPASNSVWVVFEETAAQPSQRYCIINSVDVDGVGVARTIRSIGLASRAFVANDDAYAVFVHDTTYFNTYLTLRLEDFAPAGRHWQATACGPTRTHLSSVHVVDNVATFVLPYKVRLKSELNDKFTESAIGISTLDFDNDDSHQTAQLGRGLTLAGACPQHYDGRLWTEQGFHFGPEYVPAPVQASGGSLPSVGTLGYKFWYEWTSNQGEIDRGPESPALQVVMDGSSTQITLQVPTLRVTRKTNVRICVARCLPGDTSRFWRVSSLDPTTAGAPNGYLANDTTVDSVTFVDRMSDDDLRKQEPLYTTAGVLSNDPAPLGSIITAGKNRLFCTDAQNGTVVRFSQRIAYGYTPEFAPELAHDIDPEGGDVTALAYMDDVIYAFKRSMIWAFNGDGPFENGQTLSNGPTTSGFSSTVKVSPDIGCVDPSSIVVARDGIYFKSEQGIHLIKRSREVVYIGAPVEAYNTQTVRRACKLPKRPAVLFLTDSGKSLYYDYQFDQWSTFTNHEGYDAAVVGDAFYYLRTNDVVFRETPDAYSDAGARITLRFETAWLHMVTHLQGFQRFWKMLLLGTWVSPHQLGMQYRIDYVGADTEAGWNDPSWVDATGGTDPEGWLSGDGVMQVGTDPLLGDAFGDGIFGDGIFGGEPDDVYQWRYGIFEGGQAIQFRFEDFEKAGLAGASFELTEMTIIGGVMKADIRPFSAARSM